ncbi:MAG: hypothetical protein ACJAXX_000452 [Roseivirga sp.]|jgi:hypothetical protein
MKLAYYQIEHIREYIDAENIWYDDIKIELVDHIVCNIEQQMEVSDIKFVEAAALAIEEINPSAVQQERLKVEHIATFKEVYHEAIDLFSGKKIFYPMLFVLAGILLVELSSDLGKNLYDFIILSFVALFFSFVIRTLFNKKFKPLHNVYFMSRMNAVYTIGLGVNSLIALFLTDWLARNPIVFIIYISALSIYLIAGFRVMNKTFQKLQNHVAYH